jgi:hypothetical protein
LKIGIWIKLLRKKNKFSKFISERSIVSLIHSSIVWQICLNFMAEYLFCFGSHTVFVLWNFPLIGPEYHWRDLISRNVRLVHQNRYLISFTLLTSLFFVLFNTSTSLSKLQFAELHCDVTSVGVVYQYLHAYGDI